MSKMSRSLLRAIGASFAAALIFFCTAAAQAAPLNIVAAENFYGDVAQQIGGAHVQVTSLLENPDQDPHLFEASISNARQLTTAQLVIYNGIGYDAWMEKMLRAAKAPHRAVLLVASLTHHKDGDNPHLWYAPQTMPVLARAIAMELTRVDPAHQADYESNLAAFLVAMQPLQQKIADMRARHAGIAVTATEPVFGYMSDALGFSMRNAAFQLAVMNDTEPAASDIVRMERDITQRRVRALFYNSQASNRAAQRVRDLAAKAQLPLVGITETLTGAKHYQEWMLNQLQDLDAQLSAQPATPAK